MVCLDYGILDHPSLHNKGIEATSQWCAKSGLGLNREPASQKGILKTCYHLGMLAVSFWEALAKKRKGGLN